MCLTSCALAQTFETVVKSAVYAVGLYVDPKAAKKLLSSKQADISAVQGIPEQAVFDGAHTLVSHLQPINHIVQMCQACQDPCQKYWFIMFEQSETNVQPFWAKKDCVEEVKLSGTYLLSHHTSHIAYDCSLQF